MSSIRSSADETDASRRKIFIIVGLVTALLVAALVWWMVRPGGDAGAQQAQLEGAIRPDSPDWARLKEGVVIEFIPDDDAFESPRAAGDIVMTMRPRVRNITGRTLTGLELKATVVDLQGQPVRERTIIAVPNAATGRAELENNKMMEVPIMMEGFKPTDVRANIRIEPTGIKIK